jgi:hypothetical protein
MDAEIAQSLFVEGLTKPAAGVCMSLGNENTRQIRGSHRGDAHALPL